MIRSFSFSNLWSFEDEQNISFEVGKTAPDEEMFITSPRGDRVSKALAILGANASGKTNILKVLSFLAWFVLDSWRTLEKGAPITFHKFYFTNKNIENSSFSLIVETREGIKYAYSIVFSKNVIEHEKLYIMTAESRRWSYIFKRDNSGNYLFDLDLKNINITKQNIKNQIRDNASLISIIRQYENSGIEPFIGCLKGFLSNVSIKGREEDDSYFFPHEVLKRIYDDKEFRDILSRHISSFDLGLSSISSEKISLDTMQKIIDHSSILPTDEYSESEKSAYIPLAIHTIGEEEYKFPFLLESDGTRQLFNILIRIISVLEHGGLFIYDEFEAGLHPHIIPALLKLFFSPKTNPKGAQIIFTTHATDVLRDLHKSQILLVQKDERCRSHAWRLDEMKGVRVDDNILAKYHSGAYGAIPSL